MRGHLDWHASSKGKKYLSASIKFVFDLIGGRVLELDLASPLVGLGKKQMENYARRAVITLSSPLLNILAWQMMNQINKTYTTRKPFRQLAQSGIVIQQTGSTDSSVWFAAAFNNLSCVCLSWALFFSGLFLDSLLNVSWPALLLIISPVSGLAGTSSIIRPLIFSRTAAAGERLPGVIAGRLFKREPLVITGGHAFFSYPLSEATWQASGPDLFQYV